MTDDQIIALYWSRKEDAIACTDHVYGNRLLNVAGRILNNREDSEECVSDTYLKVWNCIPPQRPSYFFAFLAKICRHLAFGRLDWNHAAKRRAEIISLSDEIQSCIPDDFPASVLVCGICRRNRTAFRYHSEQGENQSAPDERKAESVP